MFRYWLVALMLVSIIGCSSSENTQDPSPPIVPEAGNWYAKDSEMGITRLRQAILFISKEHELAQFYLSVQLGSHVCTTRFVRSDGTPFKIGRDGSFTLESKDAKIAGAFTSSTSAAGTWEVKSCLVMAPGGKRIEGDKGSWTAEGPSAVTPSP